MTHLVLLGDSVFDNGAYTNGRPAVIDHLRTLLPSNWTASLGAVDGSITDDISAQLSALPPGATHLILSVGGNNAIMRAELLESPVATSGEALLMLDDAVSEFENSYRGVVDACLRHGLPLVLCTIYNGNFPEPSYQRRVRVALAVFNDAILRVATERCLKVIDLRLVCTLESDYANPIEPSDSGGAKIARAITLAVVNAEGELRGALVVAA